MMQKDNNESASNEHNEELQGLYANKHRLYWQNEAKKEKENAKEAGISSLNGIQTVLCIDTSDSMTEGDTWDQVKEFVSEYVSGLKDECTHHRNEYNTAVVTFGGETKVQHRLTKDISLLEVMTGEIKLGGPFALVAGLILSKAAIKSTNYRWAKLGKMDISPRIIVITNGKTVTTLAQQENQTQKVRDNLFACVKEEVSNIRNGGIEIHIVYVGEPDIVFLHHLCERGSGELLPYTSGRRLAKANIIKWILLNEKDFLMYQTKQGVTKKDTSMAEEDSDGETIPDSFTDIGKMLLKTTATSMMQLDKQFEKIRKDMERDMYKEVPEMQKYAPIGSRVRRGRDWRWGNQDDSGLGTIIGHSYDDELRKYWCWVKWDTNEKINVYRYERDGKRDLAIVEEEGVPEDGQQIRVGSKVKPGDDYKGNSEHVFGIAIKVLDNKVQVRWDDDGSREELTYGIDGTPHQLLPLVLIKGKVENVKEGNGSETTRNEAEDFDDRSLHQISLPAPPEHLEVYDVFERTASLRWAKSTDHKEGTNAKYVVTYGETHNPKKKTAVIVDAGVCYILDDLKRGCEYTADIKLVTDEGESLPSKRKSFTTMETDADDTHYAGWKLNERDAARLTSAIGENWEMLGAVFGIGEISLHRIKSDNQTSTLCIYKMLLQWVKSDENPTFGKFLKALREHPSISYDQAVIRSMKEEFQLIESLSKPQ